MGPHQRGCKETKRQLVDGLRRRSRTDGDYYSNWLNKSRPPLSTRYIPLQRYKGQKKGNTEDRKSGDIPRLLLCMYTQNLGRSGCTPLRSAIQVSGTSQVHASGLVDKRWID
jgi:hypothetical protein